MSSQDNLSRLQQIAQKEEVVDTVQARHLRDKPREVEEQYRDHLRTHLSLGDTTVTEERLLTNLEEREGTIGIIAGKYAYGKTSTSISFWNKCEENGYVAVPPFIMSSLIDMLDATTGWLKHRLGDRYHDDVRALRERYQRKGIDEIATEAGKAHDVEADKLSDVITDLQESGRMNEDMPSEVLVEFFLKATDLVQDAGYEGLVVFPDEVQQFFKKYSYSHSEEEIRSLIWGFNPRSVPFGMMLSIPDEQLAVINERGADILDRVRESNLLLNLTSTYDRDFPARLWNHYAEKYDFQGIKHEIIPDETLTSIGQYATRDDLSRGPRTVIDAFGLAVTEYVESGECFTPIRFVDAYIENRLRFTEPQQKVRGAVAEAVSADVVQTQEHERAIKLMAAFPNGVTQDDSDTYGLTEAIAELGSELHGTFLTYYADGYTLVDIVEGDPDVSVGSEVLREFWREFEENDEDVADAITAFDTHVIPKLLPARGRGQSKTGWTVREANALHSHTLESYREGTFDPNYPHRGLYTRVSGRRKDLGIVESENQIDSNADLKLGFFLDFGYIAEEGINELDENETYQFIVDIKQSLMKGDLPQRIRKLKDYMNPRSVTPLLMLALTSRIDRELEASGDNMTLAEEQSLENLRENLVTETIEILFDDELRDQAPSHVKIRRLRERMVEDLFRSVMRSRFPDYHTLYKGSSITKLVGEYTSALNDATLNLGLTQKQGRRPAIVKKDDLGMAFNVKSTSSLRTKLTSKYEDLIELNWGYGDAEEVKITFTLHPLEQETLENFPSEDAGASITKSKAESLAKNRGYTEEEVEQVLRLLKSRQYVNEENNKLIRVETAVDKDDISTDLDEGTSTLEQLPHSTSTKAQLQETASTLSDRLNEAEPDAEGELEDIREDVTDLERTIDSELDAQYLKTKRDLEELAESARSLAHRCESNKIDKVESSAPFTRPLNKQRTRINNRFDALNSKAGDIAEKLDRSFNSTESASVTSLVELHELYESQQTALSSIEEQVEEQERYLAGFEEWRRLAGRAVDLDERVLQFSERSGEDEFQERLDRLFTEINEQFSDHGKELLLNAGTYDDDIKKLQEEFDERVGQKRKAFEGEKERLESLLSTANGSHPGLRVQFSEADPDESYNHLETRFSEAFTDDVLSSLQETIRDIQRTVSRSKRFQTIPHDVDVDELTLSLETVDNELQDAKDTLDEWSLESDNETDAQLAKSVAETRGKIDELEDEVEALNRPVRPESEPLQQLYEELEYGSHIQLDDILETQGNDTEDPEEIAKKLAKLFKSNLLDIQVYKRFRDLPEE